ncbi:hypothetical protein Tco_1006331 [Tanacetum coccineum]|uniref:Uncharacterized protein n=1 Tax=Tanacetum coccineum TaxID=301880 RepID=A0ABQ5FIE7_9ASTR
MEISKGDQIALDDALVAPANRLKIGKCNLRLSSDVISKEATFQVRQFFKFCLKCGNKKFEEPPLEKEILAFLASLGHSGEIRKITDVNVNKLHQPWRSFAAIINKCLSGKPSYDSLRLLKLKSYGESISSGKIPPKTKASKKKADSDATTKQKPPTWTNEVEGVDVEEKSRMKDATYVRGPGEIEADRDTNANLEGRDDVKADVVLPQVQVTQEIEDTHVTLTLVNPDGQQQSSSVSSGFVSNMLNPNQDTGVDAIFGHNAEATSLVDIPVTAIAEPSIPCTNQSSSNTDSSLHSITTNTNPDTGYTQAPYFQISTGSLFGFDNRLKALEDNFSEFKQTNQYAEALSSIPGIVDQYLANKMKEAVDVAVQLKSDRIREEAQAEKSTIP